MESSDDPTEIQAVMECLVRTQQRLLAGGYEYAAGDPAGWPLSPVLMVRHNNAVLVVPLLPDPYAALPAVRHCAETLQAVSAEQRGVIAVGAVRTDDPGVEQLFGALKGGAAYLDAVRGAARSKRTGGIGGAAPGALREQSLREFLDPAAARRHADVDCLAALQKLRVEQEKLRRFHAAVGPTGPPGWLTVTNVILAACVGVFAAMAAAGVNVLNPSVENLLAWGAAYGPDIRSGQWWRLLTSIFVHIGLIHIGFNGYATWHLGRMTERLQGPWRLGAYFLFGALAGGAASLWWSPLTVSAGASGGLFGIVGGLAAMYARFWRDLPAILRRAMRGWLLTLLFYNAVFLAVPAIDGAAHVGGLGGGFLMGLLLSQAPDKRQRPGRLLLAGVGLLLGATAAFTVWAARQVPPGDPIRGRLARQQREVERQRRRDRRVQEEMDRAGERIRQRLRKLLEDANRLPTRRAAATGPTRPATTPTRPAAP